MVNQAGRVWFTSDLHFGHRMVANLRGFGEDIKAHDEALCDNWADVVRKNDIVWVQGDDCLGKPTYAMSLLDNLPGRKRKIWGNHDLGHPMHRDAPKWSRAYFPTYEFAEAFARIRINGEEVLLSHMPYTADRGFEARYPQYRLPDEGRWLLHGHTHGTERLHDEHEIHIGLDAWNLKPVSLDSLATIIVNSGYVSPARASLDTSE